MSIVISVSLQQSIWKQGIVSGKEMRYFHEKKHRLILGKTLLDAAFFQAIEKYSEKETINCFVTGFVNGYLSV